MRRFTVPAGLALAALALLLVARGMAVPAVQVDVFAKAPFAQEAAIGEAKAAGLAAALSRPAPGDRLVTAGAAFDAAPLPPLVQVDRLAPRHLRVRVAAQNETAARTAADAAITTLQRAGLEPRLVLRSFSSGGVAVLAARLAALALLAIVGVMALRGLTLALGGARFTRSAPFSATGAASS